MATPITNADDFDDAVLAAHEAGKTVIAKFGASWCKPCTKIAPHFKKFAKEFEDLVFLDIDWEGDDIEDVGSDWGVKKLPTFVVIKEGKKEGLLQHSDHELVRNLIAPHSKSGKQDEVEEEEKSVEVLSDIKHKIKNVSNVAMDVQMDQMDKEEELKGLKEKLVKVDECKSEEVVVADQEKKQKYPASMDLEEPLCIESKNRFVLFPIANQEIWSMYKKHVASFWTAEEIDLHDDHKDWATLNAKEQHFIKYVLAFFAASDGIVLENLTSHFINDVKLPEARCFYAFQAAMENIHSETYSLLIDTYIEKDEDKNELLGAMDNIKCVREKADWALKWMARETAFCQRLVAFACVEGIFFSGSFCALFWLKKRGLMPGLTFSNELISRDEGLHTDFACLLYKTCKDTLDDETMEEIVKSAVDCEKEFICDSLPCDLIGMNSKLMGQYIEFVADRLLHALGHDKIYNTTNPFDWMEMISLQGKTNFFERRVGEYAKAGVMGSLDKDAGGDMFTLDADF